MKPMINVYYSKLFALINTIYRMVFHEEVSFEVEKFIKNLSYVGIGTIVASVFSFSYNILAGRWLGPSEYGTFTLVQSVAMFLYIPMLLGFHTAMVKYNAEKVDFIRQRSIISTTYILVFLFTVVSLLIYFIFSEEIMAIFSISSEIFYIALLFAVLFVFYTLTTGTLRSLHMIRAYSRLMPVQSAILFSAFLIFIFAFKELSFKSPLYSMLLAYGVTGGIILAFLRKYLRPEFNKEWAHKLHKYSTYSLVGGISSVLYSNIDKIVINMYMSVSSVGIYWAYNYSFTTLILLLSSIFVTVFFPVASMCSNKDILFKRINKIVILLVILGWPLAIGTGCVILKLYGGSYPFDLSLTLLFATAGICISIDKLYGQLLSSVGVKGAKITSFGAIVLALVNVILNFLLIPYIGINGAIIATIVAYLSSIGVMLLKWKDLVNSC
jgi:O-antigen/teichoic acid export membrane protein